MKTGVNAPRRHRSSHSELDDLLDGEGTVEFFDDSPDSGGCLFQVPGEPDVDISEKNREDFQTFDSNW